AAEFPGVLRPGCAEGVGRGLAALAAHRLPRPAAAPLARRVGPARADAAGAQRAARGREDPPARRLELPGRAARAGPPACARVLRPGRVPPVPRAGAAARPGP